MASGDCQARGPIRAVAYARATAMPDPSRDGNLHRSSHQHPILNPPGESMGGTRNFMVPSQIRF